MDLILLLLQLDGSDYQKAVVQKMDSLYALPPVSVLRLAHVSSQAAPLAFKRVGVYLILLDNVASCDVSTRPIYRDVGSDHHFSMIRNWLEECTTSHRSRSWSCPQPLYSFMPTRVIEVIKGKTNWRLRLHHPNPSTQKPYVALSYCWGGDQVIKTTKHTIKAWTVSLPFEILPKTIQDAIIVTSKLNILYLWVDALCIIQDDAEDMAREISQMAHIYYAAMITVAASRAKTVNEGFLQVRDAGNPPHLIFELPYQTTKGELGSVMLINPHPTGDDSLSSEPLDSRAWAFQEQLLSPRLLDYRSCQLRWKCRLAGTNRGSQYVDGWKGGSNNQSYLNSRNWLFNHLDPVYTKHEEHLKEWSGLVESYSNRSLTFLSDKLSALSAAADVFGSILSDDYVVGMWKNALRFNLCWKRATVSIPSIARPRAYQAPSWSWASINDTVIMYSPESFRVTGSKFTLQILHCHVRLADEKAPHGAVTSGVLTVKGRMKQIERNFHAYREKWAWNSMGIKVGSDMAPTKIYLDALDDGLFEDEEDQIQVFALEMFMYCRDFSSIPSSEMGHEGLLVCKSQTNDDDGVYRRVGYFVTAETPTFQQLAAEDEETWRSRNYESLKWFDDCEPQVITIL
jgi:hypothetical protein